MHGIIFLKRNGKGDTNGLLIFSLIVLISSLGFNINADLDVKANANTNTKINIDTDQKEVHAIFTEEYLIKYNFDNAGNIIIKTEAVEDLAKLSKDKTSMEKILFDKGLANSKPYENKKILSLEISDYSNEFLKVKSLSRIGENVVVADPDVINALNAMSNFTGKIQENSRVTLSTGGIALSVLYKWTWNYSPAMTLTDIVSICWSDSFDSDGKDVKFKYKQYGYRIANPVTGPLQDDYNDTKTNVALDLSGNGAGYTYGTPSVGFQKKYDIKNSFAIDSRQYRVTKHYGYIRVKVVRRKLPSTDDGAITFCGDYFHQVIKPDTELTLTDKGAELTLEAKPRFDQAPAAIKTIYLIGGS